MFLQFCLVTHTVLHSFPHLPSYLCLGPCLLPSHLFLWKLSVYLSMTKPIHLFTRPPLNYTKMITPQQIAILYPASSFPPCYIIYISTLARTNKYHTVFFKVRKKKRKKNPQTPINTNLSSSRSHFSALHQSKITFTGFTFTYYV